MKFASAILAVLAIAGPLSAYKLPSTGSGQMAKDLQEIIDLLPLDKILDITRAYIAQDKEIQLMMTFVESPDSKELVRYAENRDVFKKVAAFIQENGLDIYYLIKKYNEFMQVLPIESSVALKHEITGGIEGYVNDVASTFSVNEVSKLVKKKVQSSKPLSELIKLLWTLKFGNFLESCRQHESYLKMEKQAEQNGLGALNFNGYYAYFLMIIPVAKSTF